MREEVGLKDGELITSCSARGELCVSSALFVAEEELSLACALGLALVSAIPTDLATAHGTRGMSNLFNRLQSQANS